MKKYLFSAMALPLFFACSSEDFTEKQVVSNDPFAGIEKVNATFSMAEGPVTRMATYWGLEPGDRYGFAWMGDGTIIKPDDATNGGKAFQNHPLIQEGSQFKPQTSIYVGKYYLYLPYDETVVDIAAINFKSLEEQTITDGMGGQSWEALAKNAINIGDKWTDVTKTGTTDASGKVWEKAGIDQNYHIYAATFSNQTGLDLTYVKNNVAFDGQKINGATDINYKYPEGSTIGAADIYGGTVQLTGAAKSFSYAPKAEPNSGTQSGEFWADKSNLNTNIGNYFTWATGTGSDVITLKAPKNLKNGITTATKGNKGWFWFNSLPVTAGDATSATNVTTTLNTSFGDLTITKTLGECAYAYEKFNSTDADGTESWLKIAATDDKDKTPKEWNPNATGRSSFINQYGNHAGKYALTVDFSQGVMNGMHIKNDAHLQKALKYYIASGKTETGVVLNLDKDDDDVFKISKLSIALLQTIGDNVKVQACTVPKEKPSKIIVTQDGQAEIGLADKTEVPALNNVFAVATEVYLAAKNSDGTDIAWTWSGGGKSAGWDDALAIDDKVSSITNEGTITVDAKNIQLSVSGVMLYNASGATMNINKVTTVKNDLNNFGTINVGSSTNKKAELRAYNAKIYNNATDLNAQGVINNYGVVGSTSGTTGEFHNWGLIIMKNDDAMTLLKSNEKGTKPFGSKFDKTTNKMGKVVLPKDNPTAIVSVANTAENGFIEYDWTDDTYATPAGNVKYNTIVVSNNITFTEDEKEIQYIRFTGVRKQVVNPVGNLTELKGIIVDNEDGNASIIIEKNNEIKCSVGAFLGEGATVYKGGAFTYPAGATTNYFGTWSTDQIVEWGK